MVREALKTLRAEEGGWFVDCTAGLGGHSRAILEASPAARVLGVDRDPGALEAAHETLAPFAGRFTLIHANFKDTDLWSGELPEPPAGILADLGLSGYQLKMGRGFSFRDDGELDMRMDPTRGGTAREFLMAADEAELARVLRDYGEEPMARPVARAILAARDRGELGGADDLARVVSEAIPRRMHGKIHPATRTFQALRIHVNRELEGLGDFVEAAIGLLRRGGRLVVIAYHSLEDRIVKQTLRALAKGCVCPPKLPVCACGRTPIVKLVGARALRPSPAEVAANPSSRSARLRVAERL